MTDGHCSFFLEKKRRFCRFKPNPGQKYCAEHTGLLGIPTDRKRIICPIDSKHTCYEDQLTKHLKKCRKQQGVLPAYHCPGINSGEADEDDLDAKFSLLDIPTEDLKQLILKINKLYDEHIKIPTEILSHSCLEEELCNSSYGIPAIRHRKQQASLIGHLDKMGLIKEAMTYVELGAGKGMLSHWIQKASEENDNCNYILVDRGTCRYKADNFHKWDDKGPKFERIRIDIEHLHLGKVNTISESCNPVVAVGKHLCGSATDLAVHCVTHTLTTEADGEEPVEKKSKNDKCKKFGGLSIALCCHHRCQWKPYVGKAFFQKNGLSIKDFKILCKLSSWTAATWTGWKSVDEMNKSQGTSTDYSKLLVEKTKLHQEAVSSIVPDNSQQEEKALANSDYLKSKEKDTSLLDRNVNAADTESSDSETEERSNDTEQISIKRPELNLSIKEREEIGRKCKRLIDYGRVEYLKEKGLNCDMKVYIEEQLTPENVAIFAKPS
ncbi:tRNA:m4X modification enzyme [Mytilus galloprovincialis]|uniref:tRNA:m(4)X modification enzyme TRM13 n=1 Tax=Mytilus galloprovincialis TaxID=29158 RepID=A0A8B6E7K1_MYTGA|nr:tRNA:m4X modification enzyme [Mytilus galloprovincialis]